MENTRSQAIKLSTPLTQEKVKTLKAGQKVLISGILYTGRDAAHKRLNEAIEKNQPLPIDVKDQIIYYVGPAPAGHGQVVGSAGPTTSYRMDDLTIPLLKKGLTGMIGKGGRSKAVIEAMKTHGAIYFAAIGGAGALISKSIKKSEIIAYDDLGTEAIRKLTVENMPVYVVIDMYGNDMYKTERARYAEEE